MRREAVAPREARKHSEWDSIFTAGFDSAQHRGDVRRGPLIRADVDPADFLQTIHDEDGSTRNVVGVDPQGLVNAVGLADLACFIEEYGKGITVCGEVFLAFEH